MLKLSVVLLEPETELNLGFTARAMMNFGVRDLRLVRPRIQVSSDSMRFASHASVIVENATVAESLRQATSDADVIVGTTAQRAISVRNVLRAAFSPRDLAQNLQGNSGKVCIVFGREGTGLTNDELNACHLAVTIPTSSAYQTMNISHAVAVILYELRSSEKVGSRELASKGAQDRVLEHFDSICKKAKIPYHKRGLTVRAFQNILGRSCVSKREASLILGSLRKASEKFDIAPKKSLLSLA